MINIFLHPIQSIIHALGGYTSKDMRFIVSMEAEKIKDWYVQSAQSAVDKATHEIEEELLRQRDESLTAHIEGLYAIAYTRGELFLPPPDDEQAPNALPALRLVAQNHTPPKTH